MQLPTAAEVSNSNIQVDTQQVNTENNTEKQNKVKISQSLIGYWGLNIITLLISSSFIPLFISPIFIYFFALCIIQFVLIVPLSIFNCYKYTETKWKYFRLFILLDGTTAAYLIAMTGFIAINVIVMQGGVIQIYQGTVTTILIALNQFTLIGNFRVVMANCQWKNYQYLIAKICLLLSILCYLIVAVVFMIVGDPLQSEVIQQMKDLIFLFTFGFLTLNQELYTKLADLDGTSELKFDDEEDVGPQNVNFDQKNASLENIVRFKSIQLHCDPLKDTV